MISCWTQPLLNSNSLVMHAWQALRHPTTHHTIHDRATCLPACLHVGPLHPYQEGQTPLHAAAKAGQARCCELLLGPRNKDPFRNQLLHRRDNHNWNALMWAAHGGHAAAVVALLRAGAEMSDTLEVGEGPIVGGPAGCRGRQGL